ncbi:hypothetical protein [Pseudonocardia hierapolitana]|uniref:hypothetical protein n=1 Tax=Pseudonocardia hierapolitana TaxID=1128676 RepID=UPI001478DF4F|nr:hypothetical protein [Pseudonocardia hierapolitana]
MPQAVRPTATGLFTLFHLLRAAFGPRARGAGRGVAEIPSGLSAARPPARPADSGR